MNKKHILLLSFAGILFLLSSCSKNLDNYQAPNAGVYGSIIDSVTRQPLQTEEPNGFRVRLMDEQYANPIPIDFWGMANGSFKNTKVFAGAYKVIPIQGAFFPPDTQGVKISGMTQVNFTVTPYLSISASVDSTVANRIITTYRLSRARTADKIRVCESLVSRVPAVSSTVFDAVISHNLSAVTDSAALSVQYTDTIAGLKSGSVYYVRVGARTNNSANRFNYSPVFKVTVR